MSNIARIASLTRRFAQTSIASSSSSSWKVAAATSSSSSSIGLLHNYYNLNNGKDVSSPLLTTTTTAAAAARWMSSKTGGGGGDSNTTDDLKAQGLSNTQHEEWVKFQQSIAVEGVNTGQTTTVTKAGLMGRKKRGGKTLRKKKEKELELQKREEEFAGTGGGQFPTLRYSDEETERLLREAYACIPPRAGPRRSRHLKRERIRWWRVRKIRKTLKKQKIAAHFRRMEKRSRIVGEVLAIKDGADEVRRMDEEYRKEVLKEWVLRNLVLLGEKEDGGEEDAGKKMMIEGGGDVDVEEVEGKSVDEAGLADEKGEQKN